MIEEYLHEYLDICWSTDFVVTKALSNQKRNLKWLKNEVTRVLSCYGTRYIVIGDKEYYEMRKTDAIIHNLLSLSFKFFRLLY